MILRGLAAALTIVCVAGSANAQVPLELRGRRVVEVVVEGETSGITPVRDVGIPLGAPLTRQLIRTALARLAESGRWVDAQIDVVAVDGGVRVVAHLVPRLTVLRLELRGVEEIDEVEVRRVSGLSEGSEFRSELLPEIVAAVEELYRQQGYRQTTVEPIVRDTNDPTQKVIRLRIREGSPTRILAVRFRGGEPPSQSNAYGWLDFDEGDILDDQQILDGIRNCEEQLRQRGWLEAQIADPDIELVRGGAVIFIDATFGPRYELSIRDHEPLTRGDVEDVLELGTEPLSDVLLEGIRERVVDLYRRHGFLDAQASVRKVLGEERGTARLVIRPVPGPQKVVVGVVFPGARHFELSFLRDQIFSYLQEDLPGSSIVHPVDTEVADAIGLGGSHRFRREVPRPLVVEPQRTYYEPTYEQAIEHIRELYQADGYLGARVGPARLQRLANDQLAVEIPVVEGPRTMLHRMQATGNDVVGTRQILTAAAIERGEPFSYLALEEARLRVLELYRDQGYLYARVDPQVAFSGDRTRAEVTLEVVEGYQVYVGEIVVVGANLTSEGLVRDRITLRPGDLFSASAVRESQERLLDLGIFRSVNIAPQDADLPAQVKPLVVTIVERPPQYLELRGGISTGEGFRGGFEYGYRNLLGQAVTLRLGVQLAYQTFFVDDEVERRFEELSDLDRLERNITIGLAIPHLSFLPNVQLSLDLAHVRDNERDFGLEQFSAGLTGTWRPDRKLTIAQSVSIENNNVDLFADVESLDEFIRMNMDPRLDRLLRVPDGESTIVAFPNRITVDFRDSPFVPTEGFFASLLTEYARTISTESQAEREDPFVSNFVKLALRTSGYFPVGEDIVFAVQLQTGRIIHLTDESRTYPNRSFFLGGVDTMRGYLQDELIPQDVADLIEKDAEEFRQAQAVNPGCAETGDCSRNLTPGDITRGGDTFVLVRGELRFPIPIFSWLYGGVFAELGNLWADPTLIEPWDLRPSAGAGLRIATPVGPLALDVGFLLDPREDLNEDIAAFHFSIGLF